jgi:hypothetical protein
MSLHDKAILVSLSTAKYGLNRHDDNEAAAVAQRHGADSKSIGVTKRLLQGNAAFDAVRSMRLTTPTAPPCATASPSSSTCSPSPTARTSAWL